MHMGERGYAYPGGAKFMIPTLRYYRSDSTLTLSPAASTMARLYTVDGSFRRSHATSHPPANLAWLGGQCESL